MASIRRAVDQDRGQEKSKDFRKASTFASATDPGEVLVLSSAARAQDHTPRRPRCDFYAPAMTMAAYGKRRELAAQPPEGAPYRKIPKPANVERLSGGRL